MPTRTPTHSGAEVIADTAKAKAIPHNSRKSGAFSQQESIRIFCSSQPGPQDSEAIASYLHDFSFDLNKAASIAAAYDERFGIVQTK